MADWIGIQASTFLNWINITLDKAEAPRIESLEEGLKTGASLIRVLEVVCKKPLTKKWKKDPKLRIQQIENINLAFAFMEKEGGVKVVNIGSEDINNGSLKLILGLIWTIIYNFEVLPGLKEKGKNAANAKNALLEWIQSKIPERNIKNLKADWHDGTNVCALTNALGKELYDGRTLIPLADGMTGANAIENAKVGIATAAEKIMVPELLSAENLTNPACDENSMVTYLNMFRSYAKPEPKVSTEYMDPVPEPQDEGNEYMDPVPEPQDEGNEYMDPVPEPVAEAAGEKVPGWERPADWRTYDGIDLGGRQKIRVYFSTTTSNVIIRKNTEALQNLLTVKKVHERPDFEPWVPLDMDMEREFRNKIFEKAGTRESPFLFVDDEFIGGYDKLVELNEQDLLDDLINY